VKWDDLKAKRTARTKEKLEKRAREENVKVEDLLPKKGREAFCGKFARVLSCSCGYSFARENDCGRDWCPICRKSSHKRRMARWFSKIQKLKVVGYWVITLPVENRPRTKAGLEKFCWIAAEILKRRGFDRGLRKLHPFGDERPGEKTPWAPHINIFTESGYLDLAVIESVKKELCEELGLSQIDVNYHYLQTVGEVIHALEYVLRPTFLKKDWDLEMAEELHNFRNCVAWGRWEEDDGLPWLNDRGEPWKEGDGERVRAKAFATEAAEALRQARIKAGYFESKWALPEEEKELSFVNKVMVAACPVCAEKLKVVRTVKTEELVAGGFEKIWPGLWQKIGAPAKNVLVYNLLLDWSARVRAGPMFWASMKEKRAAGALGLN